MKKFWVLFSLFIIPLIFYIFLSEGIYKYANLPILTSKVTSIHQLDTLQKPIFINKMSVVYFLGNNLSDSKTGLFNLNQVIYKRYSGKRYFQMVAVIPENAKDNYRDSMLQLSRFTNLENWHFVYMNKANIQQLFESFKTPYQLNANLYASYAFIIDRKLRLRGRKDDDDSPSGKLYGYNTNSVAVLKNKMKDDIDIIYYQLKKSAEKEARNKRNNN
ncbi:MAG: hypothetical protein ACWA42_01105 [Lutibacter sp.]